ncbi:MAG: T9SS type A sorting domain-containing protein, partial [Chitinophagales bacterium]
QHQMMRRHNGIWDFMPEDLDLQGGADWSASMAIYNDELIVSGYFLQEWGNTDNNIMAWDGEQWHTMGGGTDAPIRDIFVYQNKLYAVGDFKSAGGIPASRIAVWDGNKWCGFGGDFHNIALTAAFYKDTLFVGGGFSMVDNDSIYYFAKNASGQSVDTCSAVTGVSEINANDKDFSVFPNPSFGKVTITLSQKVNTSFQLIISNSIGKVVRNSFLSSPSTVDISSFPSGIYLLHVRTNHSAMIEKLIKE